MMADSQGPDDSATPDAGEIRFPDVATLIADLETYIAHGVIRTAGQDLPPPLTQFSFRLVLPDGTAMALLGHVISRPADQALVQVLGWTTGHFEVVRSSIAAPSVKPPLQPPPGGARTATYTPPPMRRLTPTPVTRMTRPAPQRTTTLAPRSTPEPAPRTTPAPAPRTTPAPAARVTPAPPNQVTPPPQGTTPAPRAPQVTPPLARTLTHSGTASPNVEGGGSLPRSGTIRNPLEFPSLMRAGLDQDALSRLPPDPPLILLLRWYGIYRATGTLTVQGGSERRLIHFLNGRVLLPERAATLEDAAIWPVATYHFQVQQESELPRALRSCSPFGFGVRLLQRMLRDMPPEVMLTALPSGGLPSLRPRAPEALADLDLGRAERFFIDRLRGRESIATLRRGALIADAAITRLTALLHLSGLLEWVGAVAPAAGAAQPATPAPVTPQPQAVPAESSGPVAADVRAEYDRRAGADHFKVLGCHHSASASKLRAAYSSIYERFGPRSDAHRRSPEHARKIIALAEEAWNALSDVEARRRYRKTVLGVDCVSASRLMFDQARMAVAAEDQRRALECLDAAIDLHDDPEYRRLMDRIAPGRSRAR